MTILYKSLPSYRLEFFEGLRNALAQEDIELQLVYGDPYAKEALKDDSRALPWATYRRNRFISLGRRHAIWQPVLDLVRGSDLVVVEQASRLLINYPLLAMSVSGIGPKLAFWGHGANLQAHTANKWSEAAKRRYSRLPHWWFAYTEGTRQRVVQNGYPTDRVTVVQNAIDTAGLRASVQAVGARDQVDFLARFDAVPGHVAVFIGSLYADKRLPFLIESARYARRRDPAFTLLVAGDGPDRKVIDAAAAAHSFIHWLGRVDGQDRALLLACADVMAIPGLVGLAILDGFAAEAPIITADVPYHSPEIEYLLPDHNGLLLSGDSTPEDFGEAIAVLLGNEHQLQQMRNHCRCAAEQITTAEMVCRFMTGVLQALKR